MNEKKTRRHFNLLDVAIILLALLAVVGVWQRRNLQDLFTTEEVLESYTVTFEVKKIRSTTLDQLQKGTELYLSEDDEQFSLGVLSQQLSVAAATVYLQNQDGETVKAVYPQDNHEYLLDADGVLSCEGVTHDGSFLLGGRVYLAINQIVDVRTETADLQIRITGIEKAK